MKLLVLISKLFQLDRYNIEHIFQAIVHLVCCHFWQLCTQYVATDDCEEEHIPAIHANVPPTNRSRVLRPAGIANRFCCS